MRSPFQNPFKTTDAEEAKAFQVVTSTGGISGSELPRTNYDYAGDIGDGTRSNVVLACLNWVMRHWPEAPLQVIRDDEVKAPHPLTDLIRRPNPYYSGATLWMATVMEFLPHGNAYWRKMRLTPGGQVLGFWWLPQSMVEPKRPTDGSQFLSHYEYTPRGLPVRIEVEDMVHFRWGLDPRNSMKGLAPLGSLFREIFTDEEAANFTASILRNRGAPGLVIAPKEAGEVDAEQIKKDFKRDYTGDGRGDVKVLNGPFTLDELGWSPDQMNLRMLRQIPEERVTAVLGIPAAVVGFGTGLEQTKVGATMKELREQAAEDCLIPLFELLDQQLEDQALEDFGDPAREIVRHHWQNLRVLQDDQDKLFARIDQAVRGGWLRVDHGQAMAGLEVDVSQKIYLRNPFASAPVPAEVFPEILPDEFATASGPGAMSKAAAASLARLTSGIRRNAERAMAADLERFFAMQAAQILVAFEDQLGTGESSAGWSNGQHEKARINIEDIFDHPSADEALRTTMFGHYSAIDEATYNALAETLSLNAYDPDGPVVRELLRKGTDRIHDINGVTRKALIDHLATSEERGYSLFQTVNGVPDDGYPGVSSIVQETYQGRAQAIARTEAGFATNDAAIGRYGEAGVRELDLLDGDEDEPCASRNGTRVAIADAPDLAHPNCTLVVLPVIPRAVAA